MIDPSIIAELKSQHGDDLRLLRADAQEMIFRRPSRDHYKRFRQKSMAERESGQAKGEAAEQLVYSCLVFPEPAAASAIFERQYGLVDTFAGQLIRLAGAMPSGECEVVPL